MSATNQNQGTDSLRIIQNEDGSYSAEWDRNDPDWSWMNSLTSSEIQIIIKQAIRDYIKDK
jgi:hypothetical protein